MFEMMCIPYTTLSFVLLRKNNVHKTQFESDILVFPSLEGFLDSFWFLVEQRR